MNAATSRALMVGLLIALWYWLAGVARLQGVTQWAGIVALGCYLGAGGGVSGLQKTVLASLTGVVWVLVYDAVRAAIAGGRVVAALLLGAMVVGIALQSRVALLSYTTAALAGAGVSLGLGVNTMPEAIRAAVSLAVGALVGFAAERLAGLIATRRG